MFFVLSKILSVLISPVIWIIGLLSWSFLAKSTGRTKTLRIIAFVILIIATNPWLASRAMTKWETEAIRKDEIPLTSTAVILGGILTSQSTMVQDQFHLNGSSERLIEGLRLYNSKIIRRIIISGGNGSIKSEGKPESLLLLELSKDLLGRPKILIDSLSRNTYENAVEVNRMIKKMSLEDQPILLITSAYHMPRATKCFEKQGLLVIPYPVDYRSGNEGFQLSYMIPSHISINQWNILLKEWVGYYVYQLLGYT